MVSQILVVMIAAIAVTTALEASHPVDGAMKHALNRHTVGEDVVEDVVRLIGK